MCICDFYGIKYNAGMNTRLVAVQPEGMKLYTAFASTVCATDTRI